MRTFINSLIVVGMIGAPMIAAADDPPAEKAAEKAADAKKDNAPKGQAADTRRDTNARGTDVLQNPATTDTPDKPVKVKHRTVKAKEKHGNAVDNGHERLMNHTAAEDSR